ncbi:MAG: glycosyltransferase, partial [Planctomycetes bacterium]|nr:glycosyltransferase [Planctomycetota bacterium]
MLRWLLNVVYLLVIAAASPIVIYRMLLHGKYRSGWGQKLLGLAPRRDTGRPCVWFQAVSVGEVLQLRQIVEPLRAHRPDLEFVVSTTTVTGLAVAREKFPLETVCYFPLDFSWAVRRAIQRLRPTAIVLVELELWPNFILAAQRARVPLVLANGRISEKSFRGYRRIRPLMRRLLAGFDVLAVQSPTYAECLTKLGAPSERISVTGSIKFDGVATDRSNAKTAELRAAFGIAHHESVFIAGSTQHPEECIALDAWEALRAEFPDLRLVLVPRHKERFEDVARLVEARGLPLVRRSGKSRESRVES